MSGATPHDPSPPGGPQHSVSAAERLERLHDRVDSAARSLARRHAARLQCRRGCASCCVDEITVFAVEAERIRRGNARLLERGTPHPGGACAFLDSANGACRIYHDRPYVCRTQGLPLRWQEQQGGAPPHELRDICPLNELRDEPLERFPRHHCWPLGPIEGALATLQVELGGAPPRRVRLRDLFRG